MPCIVIATSDNYQSPPASTDVEHDLEQLRSRRRGRRLFLQVESSVIRILELVLVIGFTLSPTGWAQQTLRLATGNPGGIYEILGSQIGNVLNDRNLPDDKKIQIQPEPTTGSPQNLQKLMDGEVELALVQADSVTKVMQGEKGKTLRTIIAVTQAPIQIVVGPAFESGPQNLKNDNPAHLAGRWVVIGMDDTGNNFTAKQMLDWLKIKPNFIPVTSFLEMMQFVAGRDIGLGPPTKKADAGIWVSSAPNPNVSYLLADPAFKLVQFRADQIATLINDVAPYVAATIDQHTYPNQTERVRTVAVPTLLLSRDDIPESTVKPITTALLEDLRKTATSKLRQSRSAIDFPTIMAIMNKIDRMPEVSAPWHLGARAAIQDLSWYQRLSAEGEVYLFWLLLTILALVIFTIALLREVRSQVVFGFL